jgi:GNAT superfamily N-acetyltransferase
VSVPASRVTTRLSIRPAIMAERKTLEDLQQRASLVWEETRADLLAHPEVFALPLAQIEDGRVFVAECDGKVVGFAVVLLRDDGNAELDGLFVEPDMWRAGIGTCLVRAAEGLAASGGAKMLHVVGNPHAKDFYLACGFVLRGDEQTRFGIALSMSKTISISQ